MVLGSLLIFQKNAWLWVFGSREPVRNYWEKKYFKPIWICAVSFPLPPSHDKSSLFFFPSGLQLKLCTVGRWCSSQWSWRKALQPSLSSTPREPWSVLFCCGSWSLSCPRGNLLTSGLQNLAQNKSAWHPLLLPFIYNNSPSIWQWGKNTLLTFLSPALEC